MLRRGVLYAATSHGAKMPHHAVLDEMDHENLFVCVQRSARQVSPHVVVRMLAGVRYQLDG